MRNVFLIFSIIFSIGCNGEKGVKNVHVHPSMKIIDSLDVGHLYVEAQWLMYARYCDDTVRFIDENLKDEHITFGELRLELDTVKLVENEFIDGDSTWLEKDLIFGLNFYYDTIPFDWRTVKNIMHYGVYFDRYHSDAPGYYSDGNIPITPYLKEGFLYPPYSGVKEYIEKMGAKVHPWFKKEAEGRGVIPPHADRH